MSALSSAAPLMLNTPALVVDKAAYDLNHLTLRDLMQAFPAVAIRPHTKAHKSGILALKQLELLGPQAKGVCCQTIAEAEEMARAGVPDILLTNQVVTPLKLQRLLKLLATPGLEHLGVLVDSDAGVDALLAAVAAAAAESSSSSATPLSVWVEVDAGQGRCGVPPPPKSEAVLGLAKRIVDAEGSSSSSSGASVALRFGGIQCYHGTIQFVSGGEAREAAVEEGPVAAARAAKALLEANGVAVPAVSGGGTGTFLCEVTEGPQTVDESFYYYRRNYGLLLLTDPSTLLLCPTHRRRRASTTKCSRAASPSWTASTARRSRTRPRGGRAGAFSRSRCSWRAR